MIATWSYYPSVYCHNGQIFNDPFFIIVFNTLLCFFLPLIHFWSPVISAVTEAQNWPVKATIYCQTGNTMESVT